MAGVVDARGVRRRIQRRWRDLAWWPVVLGVCLMGLMVFFDGRVVQFGLAGARRAATLTLPNGSRPRLPFSLLLALSLGLHGLMIVAGAWMWHLAAMGRLAVRRGRARECPCCAYALGGITPEQDGARMCPECGATWRFNLDGTVDIGKLANRRLLRGT